jgi:hypothetical protein
MSSRIKQESSPYRRFTIILGSSVFVIGLALAIATLLVVNNFVVKDTIHFTQDAVQKHFAVFPLLKGIFAEEKNTNDAASKDNEVYGTTADAASKDMANHGMIANYKGSMHWFTCILIYTILSVPDFIERMA